MIGAKTRALPHDPWHTHRLHERTIRAPKRTCACISSRSSPSNLSTARRSEVGSVKGPAGLLPGLAFVAGLACTQSW